MRRLALAALLGACGAQAPAAEHPQPVAARMAASAGEAEASGAAAPAPAAKKQSAAAADVALRPELGGAPSIQAQGLSVGGWLSAEERADAAAQLLARATAAFDIGDHDGAARAAQAALYADPASIAATTLLARAHVGLGNLGKAEAVARVAVTLPGGERAAPLWMILGLAAEQDGRIDEAVAAYEKATGLERTYYAAWTNLGALYLRQESYALAVDAFESALKLRPEAPAAHCNLGSALRARTADFAGDADRPRMLVLQERALGEYLEAHRLNPRFAPAVFNLALLHLDGDASAKLSRREQLEFAVQFFEKYQDLIKQQRRGARPAAPAPVDEYLALARALLAKTR